MADAPVEQLELLYHHSDPFYAECRAYGRLRETGQEDLSIRCHGYILLSVQQLEAVRAQFNDFEWHIYDRLFTDEEAMAFPRELILSRFWQAGGQQLPPVRCLVKELVEDTNLEPNIDLLCQSVGKFHQLGIVALDIHSEQLYVEHRIADLSYTKTTPHFLLTPEAFPAPLNPDQVETLEQWLFCTAYQDYQRLYDVSVTFQYKVTPATARMLHTTIEPEQARRLRAPRWRTVPFNPLGFDTATGTTQAMREATPHQQRQARQSGQQRLFSRDNPWRKLVQQPALRTILTGRVRLHRICSVVRVDGEIDLHITGQQPLPTVEYWEM